MLEARDSSDSSSMSSSDTCTSILSSSSSDAAAAATSSTFKPHRSSDVAYSLIRGKNVNSSLTYRDFRLHRRLGSGDIGTVYLCSLRNTDTSSSCVFYAMKVVDKEALAVKKKEHRALMEIKILKMVDHPFLPNLYAEFETSGFSCFVMEYCSGGDLHSLRHRQPNRRFSLAFARFYAAEVLLALEYLHMMGIIYRDLKPENVLVRSDGHIMLSDFDLSLSSHAIPSVQSPHSVSLSYTRPHQTLTPFSCLFRSRKNRTPSSNRLFEAEPVKVKSTSFVGTHEYVAPEVASGRSHGNAVDWWAFGVFIYEMIYGRTPFAGASNEATLRSIVKQPLAFPDFAPSSAAEAHARELISGLLEKDPERRLGSTRGAADVRKHAFFYGINLALIRSARLPIVPRQQTTSYCHAKGEESENRGQSGAFDFF